MQNTQELRVQGLLERISSIVTRYEDEVNNLRVALTEMQASYNEIAEQLQKHQSVDEVLEDEDETPES